jgi:hypothetical protein
VKATFEVPPTMVDDNAALRAHVSNLAAARGWRVDPGAAISTRVLVKHERYVDDTAEFAAYAEVEVLGA